MVPSEKPPPRAIMKYFSTVQTPRTLSNAEQGMEAMVGTKFEDQQGTPSTTENGEETDDPRVERGLAIMDNWPPSSGPQDRKAERQHHEK